VDRHGKPGGHWNDAYSFVSLHQPSAYYGVNSMPLGTGRKDVAGVNAGLYELASGPEVSGYFDRVMQQRLLPSGRVSYFPMSDYRGNSRFVSLLSGRETTVNVRRKTVDATYFGTTVPSTHTPHFAIGEGVRLVPPNALPQLWQKPEVLPKHFVIVGAGKTAMDAGVWLVNSGANPDTISWVMPRDSWLLNRLRTQPGIEFFDETIGGQVAQMQAFAEASSVNDLFDRLEAAGVMLRIDTAVRPTMFHYATMSVGEVEVLRRITRVIRLGRVQALEAGQMVLDQGTVAMDGASTLYVDCTASAVERKPAVPIFQPGLITPQMVRVPQPAFSAALIARVEAGYASDRDKNALCTPVPLPATLAMYPAAAMGNMINQFQWSQDKALRHWIFQSRLDGFGKVIAAVDRQDDARQAMLAALRTQAMAAMANLPRLMAQ
ncbi:MAG: NAD(P)/FAD-dependent oxidoreductase, partial [Hyphomonadaceae bacterium]|nr:NAD(P)/FAD-dependent oxidoreductase [Hyphomonadaceae bacterium]